MERKYTVTEIDEMRALIERHYHFGWYVRPESETGTICSGSYNPAEMFKVVEERLRTLMVAGITPDDLRKSAQK